MINISIIALTITSLAGSVPSCERNTHDYAGEANHVAISQDRVAFSSWWANQGQSEDLIVLECATGQGIAARTFEIDMSEEPPFDNRFTAWDILAEIEGSGFLLTLDQMAERFDQINAPTRKIFMKEACACKAAENLR